jgi:hypothetical protein
LNAGTYQVERVFTDPPRAAYRRCPQYIVSPKGNFAYLNALLPAGQPLTIHGSIEGCVCWNDEVVLPMLLDLNMHCLDGQPFPKGTPEKERVLWGAVWMSLTPSEIITQRSGVEKATGKVVIGGLGLAWFLRKVCEKEAVTEVVVVEKSQEILDWYGYDLCRKYPKVKAVICNDVYNEIDRHGDCQYLLDIWPIYQGASRDRRLRAVRKRLGSRLWAWGID